MSSDLAAPFSYRRRHRCCPSSLFELFRQFLLLASGCVAICHGQQPLGGAHGNRREGPPPTNCAEYWQFPCEDGQHCIARYDQCDGIEQCPDASDEKHCQPNERPPNELGRFDTQKQQQQHERSSTEAERQQKQTTIATNASGGTSAREKRVPLELLLMGAAAFVLVAALVHAVMKATRRRRLAARGSAGAAARRGFRKGESLVEDEDDLLISQMYG
ncbi:hypothetical protein GPALN_011449 [Globodera pallida]|nr:hypothetical protein GPALN_011449 [Globodera pallida]